MRFLRFFLLFLLRGIINDLFHGATLVFRVIIIIRSFVFLGSFAHLLVNLLLLLVSLAAVLVLLLELGGIDLLKLRWSLILLFIILLVFLVIDYGLLFRFFGLGGAG